MTIWKPDISASTDPIYLAIAKAIGSDIAAGRLRPGDRLPTHRELAKELDVSIGTVTRGYAEAMRRGSISGETGRGTYVKALGSERPVLPANLSPDSGLIDLSMSHPVYCAGPDLREALRALAQSAGTSGLLRYLSPHTQPRYVEAGAVWMRSHGVGGEADSIVITAGAQHALTVILSALTKAGDLVFADELTYPGLITIAQAHGLRLQGIATDESGMDPDALAAACRQRKAQVLYTVPTLHNPTSAILPDERRTRLAETANEYDLLIIEDDVHRPLVPGAPTPLSNLAPERTFFIASMSKAVAGGLRVAYVTAPPFAREQLKQAIWTTMLAVPSLTVELATMWIEDGTAFRTVELKRVEAQARQSIAREILHGYAYRSHPMSYNVWLELPDAWTGADFALEARRIGVAVTPAGAFAVDRLHPPSAVRICLGAAEDQNQLRAGLQVIGEILKGGDCRSSALV